MLTPQTERCSPGVRGSGRRAKMCRAAPPGEVQHPNPAVSREEFESVRDRGGALPANLLPARDSIREGSEPWAREGQGFQAILAGSRVVLDRDLDVPRRA